MTPVMNSPDRYGVVAIFLHWVMAAMIIGLFFLGEYMVDLNYTHRWYNGAPHLHESVGLLLFALLIFRTVWTAANPRPLPLPMPAWERFAAATVKKLFYLLLFGITISGYLIPTADGKGIELFNWFTVPATVAHLDHQEDIAGSVHHVLVDSTVILVILHALAALKHHFLDKDATLMRMIGKAK